MQHPKAPIRRGFFLPDKSLPVGTSLLAMVVNDGAASLTPRGVLRFIVGAPPGAGALLQDSRPVLAAMLV
ncbi:hypothetical protein J3D47_000713 [Pseudomonas laurylsulfativorans]|nr:hypothetical protein [Pseudomonas laurylsulfativorans]